eukprot:872881-Amphidinium_carterae.1
MILIICSHNPTENHQKTLFGEQESGTEEHWNESFKFAHLCSLLVALGKRSVAGNHLQHCATPVWDNAKDGKSGESKKGDITKLDEEKENCGRNYCNLSTEEKQTCGRRDCSLEGAHVCIRLATGCISVKSSDAAKAQLGHCWSSQPV